MSVTNARKNLLYFVICTMPLFLSVTCQAQYRPSLFFREDWREIPPETPVNQGHVANPDLILTLYGAAIDSMRKSNHDHPSDDPFYVWSGLCKGNWALTLKNPGSFVDLSEYAKIKWRTKQSGYRCLHILLKLADGTWLVSDQCDGRSVDWLIREFNIGDIRWYSLDIETITERQRVDHPDLTRVDEIGFTDLMAGGSSPACSRVDWIEVYGKAVKR
ncbi:MAG: hypothetical protein JW861_12960 [Bacteroidales bacterium]|nr:hypothetical protein [Bacteroidales bacterium]